MEIIKVGRRPRVNKRARRFTYAKKPGRAARIVIALALTAYQKLRLRKTSEMRPRYDNAFSQRLSKGVYSGSRCLTSPSSSSSYAPKAAKR
jgi:hypothetical protein